MPKSQYSKSQILIVVAAVVAMDLAMLAIFFIVRTDTKEDPTITASYKSLNKKLKLSSPLPPDLTADFLKSRDGHWIANGPVKDKELRELAAKQPVLDAVYMSGGEITADGLESLVGKNVRKLKIHYTPLDEKFAETISKLKELDRLDLREKSVDDDVVCHLTGLPKLNELLLKEARITKVGVQHIVSNFPQLGSVEITDDPNFDDECFFLLKGLKNLRRVHIDGTAVTEDAILSFLNTQKKIEDLGIADLHLDDQFVAKLPTNLQGLDLSYNPITDASIETLGRMKNLVTFKIVGKTMVTTDGLQRLRKLLPGCKTFCTKKGRDEII